MSELQASPEAVWHRVTSLEGINQELGPWLRMTAPAGVELTPEAVPLGKRWFRSWILLFGVLPVDYDDLRVELIEPNRRFLERSTMLSARSWEHDRSLEPVTGGGTRLTDRVTFTPRVALTGHLHRALIQAIFRHRHRRLRRFFSPSG